MTTIATNTLNTALPPVKIGGWMVLPLLGLAITLPLSVYRFYVDFWPLITKGYFAALALPSGIRFDPAWARLLWLQALGPVLRFVLGTLALWGFYRRSRHTPLLMIGWLLLACLCLAAEVNFTKHVPELAKQPDTVPTAAAIRSVVHVLIWVPYFLLSKRVEQTFTK